MEGIIEVNANHFGKKPMKGGRPPSESRRAAKRRALDRDKKERLDKFNIIYFIKIKNSGVVIKIYIKK